MTTSQSITPDTLDKLHTDMATENMAPTWQYISSFITKAPRVTYRPWLWKWDDVYPLIARSGELITPERGAERRSMEHVNPDLKSSYSASHTLATAFQLVRAGEKAPAHRHAAGAIRFAASSHGGTVYTKVQGERLMMQENDLLLTPSGTWHEHANETDHDIIWLDVLDFPLVNLMQASWFEPGEGQVCPDVPDGYSNNRVGIVRPPRNLANPPAQPILRYPWEQMRDMLHTIGKDEQDPYDGVLLDYVNPLTSGPTLPTMSCRAQLLYANTRTRAHRATSSTIYYVISGEGTSVINGIEFSWSKGDVFVVPPWAWHEHSAHARDVYLFSSTDQPTMEKLGLYREEALDTDAGQQVITSKFAA